MSERRSRRRKLTVEVIANDGNGRWDWVEDVHALVQAAAAEVATEPSLDIAPAAMTVVLSNDAEVAQLNGQYRGKPKPTNVLSFPAGEGAEPGFAGDIVIAAETVLREAQADDIPPEHHLTHLVVHGMLHLLGFDHEKEADAHRMESAEIAILARLGVANPYTGPLNTSKT